MKFKILNFKSIKSLDFEIGNEIKYLIGKNESGKSNILDAIWQINNQNLKEDDKNFNSDEKELMISYSFELDKILLQKWNFFLK